MPALSFEDASPLFSWQPVGHRYGRADYSRSASRPHASLDLTLLSLSLASLFSPSLSCQGSLFVFHAEAPSYCALFVRLTHI
jgi:hypothetical protein